ncbi:MAG: hypothetical protein J3Q66DRAFT_436758 [Benniella sp.]|nr:MAG: hypothetical protein J3Q66DRAFT_436758 [Benniella sp.]
MGHWYGGLRIWNSRLSILSQKTNFCTNCFNKQKFNEVVFGHDTRAESQIHGDHRQREDEFQRAKRRKCLSSSLDDEYQWQNSHRLGHNKKERVIWNKYEWRYFMRTCDGTDVVSGLPIAEIGREVAHLRLQARDSVAMDLYDHEPLVIGDENPMRRFSTDRTTSGGRREDAPVFSWPPVLFLDMTLEQRVKYMLYWSNSRQREEGFQRADRILLQLFDYTLDEERKIEFTNEDHRQWQKFRHCMRPNKERIVWDKYQWRHFMRTCERTDSVSVLSMAEIGLNFVKEMLEEFKISKLFQGTDLENCRKGVTILRDLMIETAERMRYRLPMLLEEHGALVAGSEDSNDMYVEVAEEPIEDTGDLATNGETTEKEMAASFWTFAENDDDEPFLEVDHSQADLISSSAMENSSRSDERMESKSTMDATSNDLSPESDPLMAEFLAVQIPSSFPPIPNRNAAASNPRPQTATTRVPKHDRSGQTKMTDYFTVPAEPELPCVA